MEGEDIPVITWTFHGRVLPDVPLVSLHLPKHTSRSSLGFEFETEGHIYQSKILAVVRQRRAVDIWTLRNAVASDVQVSVDLASFLFGAGLVVDIISAQSDEGEGYFFDAFIPAVRRADSEMEVPTNLIATVAMDTASQIALSDFREAMRVPIQTGFFCYRAIEATMQSFKAHEGEKDPPAWERLRTSLHVERSALDRIKLHADWARHGRQGKVTDGDRAMLLTTTREIISRYLAYASNGRLPLSQAEFAPLA